MKWEASALLPGEPPSISGHAWWHGVGSQTLRHWNFLESSWCCILGGHSPHVGEPLGAPLCSGVHGEREGLVMRKRNSTDQKNRITLIASFDSHCIFKDESPPTRLSAEGRSCKTAKHCPRVLCWMSTRRRRGLTRARMSARRARWRICTGRSTARHAASTPCI